MKRFRKILSLILSATILVVIFQKIGTTDLLHQLMNIDLFYLVLSMIMFIPQILLTGWRWHIIVNSLKKNSFKEAIKITLSGTTLNLILPSKAGDLSKAFFLWKKDNFNLTKATSFVIIERVLDIFSLTLLMLVFIVLIGYFNTLSYVIIFVAFIILSLIFVVYLLPYKKVSFLKKQIKFVSKLKNLLIENQILIKDLVKQKKLFVIASISLVLWITHLIQFWFFFLMFGSKAPTLYIFAFVPLAIFIGLIPITLAGIGTRDAALISLFLPWNPPALMASIGLFATLRYVIPALLGLPFFHNYFRKSINL